MIVSMTTKVQYTSQHTGAISRDTLGDMSGTEKLHIWSFMLEAGGLGGLSVSLYSLHTQ